jgi:prepilin-type processing-associated H-X9-DG protein
VDVALAFVEDMQAGRHGAAYKRLSPVSRKGVTEAEWTQSLSQPATDRMPESYRYVFQAGDYSVGTVAIEGEQGTADVTLRGTKPLPLPVVREARKWWVDWTDAGQARATLEQTLDALTGRLGGGMTMAAMYGMPGGAGPAWSASPLLTGCRAVSCAKEGDRAVVRLAGTGELRLMVPLRKSQSRWAPSWEYATPITGGADRKAASEAVNQQFEAARQKAAQASCASNLKQLAIGMLMYAQDYDEHFPPAERWSELIYPYVKNEQVFRCPGDPKLECGYAFNRALSGKRLAEITRPAETPLLFDSKTGKRNAADDGRSWPSPGRHNDGNDCAFADGHVKWFREKPSFALQTAPGGPQ